MKRCPTCHKEYMDETLNFCLEDGEWLIDGDDHEPTTAVLPEVGSRSEAPTRLINPVEPVRAPTQSARQMGRSFLAILIPTLLLIAGFLVYRYVSVSGGPHIESIAVMPFVNASGNPDMEYLSDGITHMLISSLSPLSGLSVKAPSSVFRYKGKDVDTQVLGRELNVQAILNGRVVQRGEDLTLYLSLVDAKTENEIWGKQYSRKLTNLVAMQSEIARDVAENLKPKLSGGDEQRLAKKDTENPDAYKLYLQGRFFWNKRSAVNVKKAIGYFEQAIALDPNYARAYAGLADAHAVYSEYDQPDILESRVKAREAAEKALTLDEGLAEAHSSLGTILMSDYDLQGAEREFKRAIELDPNYATARHWYGRFLSRLGRFEEAIAEQHVAIELEPFSPVMNSALGNTHCFARRYDECMAQYRKALELDPNYAGAYANMGLIYLKREDYGQAVEHLAKAADVGGEHEEAEAHRKSFANGGWPGFLRHVVEPRVSDSPYNQAWAYLGLGNKDEAFKQLNRSFELREPKLTLLKVDPLFDGLRDDPRYFELLRKVGFPE